MIPYAQQHEPDNVVTLTLFLHMPSDLHIFLCTGYVDMRKSMIRAQNVVEFKIAIIPRNTFLFLCRHRTSNPFLLYCRGVWLLERSV